MTPFALIIKHRTQPGKREEVRPDSIWAFQQYASSEASQEFLQTSSYAVYLKDVEPLLAVPPQVTALTSMWSKEADASDWAIGNRSL